MNAQEIFEAVFAKDGNEFAGTKAYCDATGDLRLEVRALVSSKVRDLILDGSPDVSGGISFEAGAIEAEQLCNQFRHLSEAARIHDAEEARYSSLPYGAEEVILGFAKRVIFKGDSQPAIVGFGRHPKNGWLVTVHDADAPHSEMENVQLTDNECHEMGGFTTRHLGVTDEVAGG